MRFFSQRSRCARRLHGFTNHHLREDWLNDAVKGFVVQHPQRIFLDAPHLKVYVPEPDYLLAMKTLA